MNFHAVIFDLDGTLIDSLHDIATAVNRVLRSEGYPEHPVGSFRTLVGDGVVTLFQRALPPAANADESIVGRCVAGFHREYNQCWHDQSQLYEGIEELLSELTARRIPLAILSNKPHNFTVQCAEYFLNRWEFRQVLGQREGIARKPDPAGALEIATALEVEPGGCLYVGDTSVDMETATAAGMFPLGVAWGFRSRQELIAHGARRIIEHPRELLELR